MRKNLFVVTLMVLWFSTVPVHASTIWTVVSFLADTDVTLVPGADGRLDFSDFTINAGSLVNFDADGINSISIYSVGDITIDGVLDALGYNLTLNTGKNFILNSGAIIKSDWLTIFASQATFNGSWQWPGFGEPDVDGNLSLRGFNICLSNEDNSSGLYTGGSVSQTGEVNLDGPIELPAPVPEPATLLLLGCGLVAVAGMGRRIRPCA